MANRFTPDRIRRAVEALGYTWFSRGAFNLNMVAIRLVDSFDNRFSDVLTVTWNDERGQLQYLEIPWTTRPGTLGQGGVFSPITTTDGVTGAAVLVPGQYRGCWQFVDSFTAWPAIAYPYMQQVAPMQFWRDGNRDTVLDKGRVYEGLIGCNCHRMSPSGVRTAQVNFPGASWSIACQGAPEPDFALLLPLWRHSARLYGPRNTYTLLTDSQIPA